MHMFVKLDRLGRVMVFCPPGNLSPPSIGWIGPHIPNAGCIVQKSETDYEET